MSGTQHGNHDQEPPEAREHVLLQGFPGGFLAELPPPFVTQIESLAEIRTYAPGTCLFSEGQPATEFQIVRQGHVRLEMSVPGRGKVNLLTVGPGEILAWSALLSAGKLTATGIALDAVEILAIPGPTLRQLCAQHTELGYQVMKQLASALSRRLLATRIQLLDLFSAHEPVMSLAAALAPIDPEC